MQKSIKNNGFNVIILFTEENSFKGFPYLFKKNELKNLYENQDWDILKYREFITPLEKYGIAILIARKKSIELEA